MSPTDTPNRIMETLSETTRRLISDCIARDMYYTVFERTFNTVIPVEDRHVLAVHYALTDVVNEEQPE